LTLNSINRINDTSYFSVALKIYSEGRYFEASIGFERAIFNENDSSRIDLYRYYKSLCYKRIADYDNALKELERIKIETKPDSLYLIFRYEQLLCSYLNQDLNQAMSLIDGIYKRFRDTISVLELLPLNILCLNACREWDNARTLWYYYIDNSVASDSAKNCFNQEVSRLYEMKNLPKFYSAGRAGNLSTFLPGSGQIYSGAVLEGSFNLIINMALLYYAVNQLTGKYYLTGYFIGLKLFNKFYSGGIRRAESLANNKNEEELRIFNIKNSSLIERLHQANTSGY